MLPAKVVVLGGGVSGTHAAEMAVGMRADVTLFDISPARLEELDVQFDGRLKTVFSTHHAVAEALTDADLVIGCVLLPGAAAPKLVKREDLKRMRKGSVLVDVAIDQGGCFETSHPTTHAEPTFEVDGIIHYCVANMPGAAPTDLDLCAQRRHRALCLCIGQQRRGCGAGGRQGFALGLNVKAGKITHPAVAEALKL